MRAALSDEGLIGVVLREQVVRIIEHQGTDGSEISRLHIVAIAVERNLLSDVHVPFVTGLDNRQAQFIQTRRLAVERLEEADERIAEFEPHDA